MAAIEDETNEEAEVTTAVPGWRKSLSNSLSKFRSRRSWVAIMFLLGTADLMLNLTNFVYLSDDRLNYGLVIGPPSFDLWVSMCVFTIIGTLFYFPETANTVSALYDPEGETLVPIHLELVITLLLEHIPLAIIDYFIARCRRQFTTKTASWCHIVRLVFIFIRLVWYAHMEGKKLRKNDKYQIKQVLVLLCCLLYSISIAFNIMNWYNEPDTRVKDYHLVNVSIFLLDYPPPPEQLFFEIQLTDVLRKQSGKNLSNAWLTDSLREFYIAKGNISFTRHITATYKCHESEEYPIECEDAKSLKFKFMYGLSDWSPYGEIRYNFAMICPAKSKHACVESTAPMKKPWRLFFYEGHKTLEADNITVASVFVRAPFRKAYTHPRPMYSSEVPVCLEEEISCTGRS